MWLLYLGVAPMIVLTAAWLIRKKMYRDTAVFAAVSLAGFALWVCVAHNRPIFLNAAIGRIVEAAKSLATG
jgi:hypothetical protein